MAPACPASLRATGLGSLLATPAGRAYLVRVPGVAQAPLDDERLAALLNWVSRELSRVASRRASLRKRCGRCASIRCATRSRRALASRRPRRRPG